MRDDDFFTDVPETPPAAAAEPPQDAPGAQDFPTVRLRGPQHAAVARGRRPRMATNAPPTHNSGTARRPRRTPRLTTPAPGRRGRLIAGAAAVVLVALIAGVLAAPRAGQPTRKPTAGSMTPAPTPTGAAPHAPRAARKQAPRARPPAARAHRRRRTRRQIRPALPRAATPPPARSQATRLLPRPADAPPAAPPPRPAAPRGRSEPAFTPGDLPPAR